MCQNSSTYKFLWAMKRNYKMNITLICNNLNLQLSRFHLLTTCSLRLHFTIRPIKVIINISQHNERLVHGKKKKYVFRRCFCDSLDIFLHISNVNIKKFVNGTLLALKIPISLLEFFNKSLPLQMIEANNYKWLKLCFTDDRNLHVP